MRRCFMKRLEARNARSTVLSLLFAAIALLFFAESARSEFPERGVTFLVGMEAGGLTDLITRALAIGTASALKQPVMVENRAGGGGGIAAGVVAAAKPDGYTLAVIQNVTIVDLALMQKVPYKPLKSFTPVTAFSCSDNSALLVNNDSPWKTFGEFIRYAKDNPGKIKWSVSGLGTGMHVAMEVIAKRDGIKWVCVPQKGGPGARTALMGKHVDACSYGADWPIYTQEGTFRVLVTHGRTRSTYAPNVPTLLELGYNFMNNTLHSVVGPAGLPVDVVAKLEAAIAKGMETPEFKTTMEKLYLSPAHYNSKDYTRSIEERWDTMEKLFKEVGMIKEAATQPY
jgi:tripartite-type tricarboxylate transporter receptor subunit TctC